MAYLDNIHIDAFFSRGEGGGGEKVWMEISRGTVMDHSAVPCVI